MGISRRTAVTPRLLVRPSPLKGEGLRGYLLRVGEANGQEWGVNVWRLLTGTHNHHYRVSETALDHVANSLGLCRDQVAGMIYRPASDVDVRGGIFFGHAISVLHLRRKPAVCPHCLIEQNVISGLWELNAVCACPQHGNWLIDQCPACGESFHWNRPRVSFCQCGFDLRTVHAEAAPQGVLVVTSLIYDLVLNSLPMFDERSMGYPPEIRQLSLNELLGLIHYAKKDLLPGFPFAQPSQPAYVTDAFALHSQSLILLSSLLKCWPDKFLIALAGFQNDGNQIRPVLHKREFKRRYGRVLSVLLRNQNFCQAVPDFVSRTLVRFVDEHRINDHFQGRYLNPSVVWAPSNTERMIKRSHCQEALLLPIEERGDEETLPFSAFLQMKEKALSGVVLRSEAPRHLGCSEDFLLALVDSKMLRAWNKHEFYERSLEEVLSKFDRIARHRKKDGLKPRDLLPLARFVQTERYPSRRLIKAVFEHAIGLYKERVSPIRSLSDLYVAKSDMQRLGEKIWLRDFWKVAQWF